MSLSGLNTLQPIEFIYEHDSNLVINQDTFTTQQGLKLNLINALSSCKDATILNYSNIFLSDTVKANDFAYMKQKAKLRQAFPTYLALSAYPSIDNDTFYVQISSSPGSTYSALSTYSTFNPSLSDDLTTYFDFIDIDGIRCRISTRDLNTTKSLTVQLSTLSCYFATQTDWISSTQADLFEYSLDSNGFLKLFFRYNDAFYIIRRVANTLSAVQADVYGPADSDIFATSYSKLNPIKFTNDFVYYDKENVADFEVKEQRSIKDLPQNHLLYYNYESNSEFLTGAKAKVDFFKGKNFLAEDFSITDKLPFSDEVTQRKYTTILSKNNSERYEGSLQFNYNYFTKTYTFIPDVTTKFTLPETLYPYESLNIDDSSLINNGAYGGQSPVFSDKIYKNLNFNTNKVAYNQANGTYLCTWLYTDTALLTSYWVDRYYYPKATSITAAFTGGLYPVFSFVSDIDQYITANYPLNNFDYYDLRSSLVLEPTATYLYSRIGNKYINKVTETYPVYTNTFTKYVKNSYYTDVTNSIDLNNNYGMFVLKAGEIDNSFSLSFDLKSDNLSAIKTNVIIGNNYDEGITIYKGGLDNIFTPGFFVTSLHDVKFYNRDLSESFTLNLSSYINAPYRILDVLNYGFDHPIKIFYYNYTTNLPGFVDININKRVVSKIEFTDLPNYFQNGVVGKTYDNNYIYYHYLDANNHIVKIDYINNVFISDTTSSGLIVYGSRVVKNNTIIPLSGFRGCKVGDYGVSKINNTIYYKNLDSGEEFPTLSSKTDKFFDIISYNNQLFVQTKQDITIFDQYKRQLGTFATNTSAVSGFKLDVLNENFNPKLLSLFKTQSGYIGFAKYNIDTLELESSSATSLSAYDNFYQEINNPVAGYNSLMCTPTNLEQINIVNKFNQGDIVIRTDLFSGNDYQNKTANVIAVNLEPYYNQNLTLVFNSNDGYIQLYNEGILIVNESLSATGLSKFVTSYFMNNNFGIGMPFIDNKPASEITNHDYASNYSIENFKVYKKSLNEDEVKFNFLKDKNIDAVTFDVPAGTRNNTDTVQQLNKFSIPGRKNNNVRVYIKNLDLDETNRNVMTQKIIEKIGSIVPINTQNIQLIYINNE